MKKHTATPWQLGYNAAADPRLVMGANILPAGADSLAQPIAGILPRTNRSLAALRRDDDPEVQQAIADGDFIVRACNVHDDLVAALESATVLLAGIEDARGSRQYAARIAAVIANGRAALVRAAQ